jgi:hypothetical protein
MALSSRMHYEAIAEILYTKQKEHDGTILAYFDDKNRNTAKAYAIAKIRRDFVNELGAEFIKLFEADNERFDALRFKQAAALYPWQALD